ncbi:dynamin protein dnm1 [Auriculariales sp. MPI-PUGE-AT-0066]|nr:dynamin protein dnm1 [Auriculariales sp. MPI-PUGE-AT-0066]
MDGDLIKLVNKLQDTFHNLGGELDMPQIVVVGSQSAGKSSVLETIVGRDFLPRGQGIVTRRPLVLQLIHSPADEEWAQFLHVDKRFTDWEEIRKEIEAETFRVAGQNKGISKLPINLKIHSPNVLDLTLVDLPGLTKIPVGDQPGDIERQIRNLVNDYISKPNSIILSVSGANVDLANSDSLKLARTVDPQGRRTIGVLTKLDLMDAGTNALDVLMGRVYTLKLGFIGVVNRSQQDINMNVPMTEAHNKEDEFFRSHPAYRNIAHKNGTRYLARSLNQVLLNHIRDKLPDMKARLNTLMGQTQQELNSFGDAASFGDANQQSALILRLMTQFARDFVSSVDGTSVDISTKELSGGARIYYIFNDIFGMALNSLDPANNLDTQDIRTAIRNSTGPRPSLFVPEVAFDLLVKPQIKLLEAPSLRCVELVYEELVKICHNCTSNELQRFPRLHSQLIEVVSELLRERLGPTSEYAESMIQIQTAYINTNHPEFVTRSASAAREASHPPPPRITRRLPEQQRPESTEPEPTSQDEDDETADNIVNGAHTRTSSRVVSSALHDRSRSRAGTPVPGALRPQHPLATVRGPPLPGQGQAGSAKETFLNYFFGGQQPSAAPGSPVSSVAPSGRDLSPISTSTIDNSGLLHSRTVEGSSAAFDMKSLGKHIEALPSDDYHPSMREEMETTLIRSLIASYFGIVRQSIQDLVPKAIMHFLVNYTCQHVQNRLVSAMYKPELFTQLLHEDETIVNERNRVKALLEAYKEAFKTLSEVGIKST